MLQHELPSPQGGICLSPGRPARGERPSQAPEPASAGATVPRNTLSRSILYEMFCYHSVSATPRRFNQIQRSVPATVRQNTSVLICLARLKKVLIELLGYPVPELESLV